MLFFYLYLGLLLVYRLFSFQRVLQIGFLIAFSLYFYYRLSDTLVLVLLASTTANYLFGYTMFGLQKLLYKRILLWLAVLANIGLLGYYKYTNFFLETIASFSQEGSFTPLEIIVPAGISYFTFKALSYVFDVYYERIEEPYKYHEYLLYQVFFANIQLGPIDRATDFLPQVRAPYSLTKEDTGRGVLFAVSGLIKIGVISEMLGTHYVNQIFQQPNHFEGIRVLIAIYAYALMIYCNFSGYSDLAMAVGQFLGFRLRDNFNAPYQAVSIADFWRRWHISLSTWLLDYLFTPLQMSFRRLGNFGTAIALLITFFLCGVWHGAGMNFVVWGAYHGIIMAISFITRDIRKSMIQRIGISEKVLKPVQIFITFHLIGAGWILFGTDSIENAGFMITQIRDNFHASILIGRDAVTGVWTSQLLEAYWSTFVFMLLGAVIVFFPKRSTSWFEEKIIHSPLLIQAFLLALSIWLVAQAKSADLSAPIYFQF